jgi:hypothetical protein
LKKKWFKPKKHTGWEKDQNASTRRRKLMDSTSKAWTRHRRYLQAGRRAQALANVTADSETRKKAQADADYFFSKLK